MPAAATITHRSVDSSNAAAQDADEIRLLPEKYEKTSAKVGSRGASSVGGGVAERQQDALGLAVGLDALGTVLAADAGVLETAERCARVEGVHVDRIRSGADLARDLQLKAIGKTIKKNMLYVVYKNKQTGDVKEVELGLTLKQIRLRLNGYKQAEKRKV